MKTEHPITPPPELVKQWLSEEYERGLTADHVAAQAARWGADQELEACCADLRMVLGPNQADWLRSVRRPKPLGLKDQAKQALGRFFANEHTQASQMTCDFEIIRRAVESLPD